MRIVAIGLGGAGSRIVDRLYAMDRRSSKVACVQGLAIDVDEESLKSLGNLPDSAKMFFPPLDAQLGSTGVTESPTATIDISEIISKIQNFESGETDAIILCLGLGGSLTDAAPHIIAGLRSATTEAVFGLVTLPCLAEGEKRSARAADGIDMLAPLLDGMILFDNETWYKKTATLKEKILNREKGWVEKLGFGRQEPDLSPQMITYRLLNDSIVRRISLILRAGEFRADGGIDLAEVVLDSGEVLNTMKGMGFITIGYAVEPTDQNPLGFLSQWRPKGIFDEENKKKASRIVDLAKQAIYQEISTPCDMTSAHKALILVAGPSHELSMKGFMTVRKWIDRSIAGLETRSGDYPIVNTKNVAIIIMLSGLENIPRVGELQEIREHYRHPVHRNTFGEFGGTSTATPSVRAPGEISDEMIVLPQKMQKSKRDEPVTSERPSPAYEGVIEGSPRIKGPGAEEAPVTAPAQGMARKTADITRQTEIPERGVPPQKHQRPAILEQEQIPDAKNVAADLPRTVKNTAPSPSERRDESRTRDARISQSHHSARIPIPPLKETPRQKVERELERQRIIATPERVKRINQEPHSPQKTSSTVIIPRSLSASSVQHGKDSQIPTGVVSPLESQKEPEQRKVIISRKKAISPTPTVHENSPLPKQEKYIPADEPVRDEPLSEEHGQAQNPQGEALDLKEPSFKAKDRIFEGKTILKGSVPPPRDSAFLKANLHLGKKHHTKAGAESDAGRTEQEEDGESKIKKDKSIKNKDDISWI
jgi:cell division GTPase FtsZ